MKLTTRRLDVSGYLEYIYAIEPDASQRAIAYITDIYGTIRKPHYCGVYGIHVVEGSTVCAVKEQLFSLIEDGQ